jgi:2-keto-4-pentenoate hydratase
MPTLDLRQKAERIVELFRSRRPTEMLSAELYPASLDEAYAIQGAFQEIEEATGRGVIAGYKIGLTTPVMQRLCGVDEPCDGAIFLREGHHRRALLWLAQKLAAAGTPLQRGMIVMTGSMVPIQYPAAGDRVLVEVSALGAAELAVT